MVKQEHNAHIFVRVINKACLTLHAYYWNLGQTTYRETLHAGGKHANFMQNDVRLGFKLWTFLV